MPLIGGHRNNVVNNVSNNNNNNNVNNNNNANNNNNNNVNNNNNNNNNNNFGIPGGDLLFTTDNEGKTCAAYSQIWLALSLIQGAPVTNPGVIQVKGYMKKIQAVAGQPSVFSLADNGMEIEGQITMQNVTWVKAFFQLSGVGDGFYSLTIKGTNFRHAIAFCCQGNTTYYLEPQHGLYKFTDLGAFVLGTTNWYSKYSSSVDEFKIYKVKMMSNLSQSATAAYTGRRLKKKKT